MLYKVKFLPKIDDDVDNMLGLAELYQSVRTAALNQKRQPQLVSVFTTELFAYYLHITSLPLTKCHLFMKTLSADEFKRCGICISDTEQLFIGDVLLFLSASRLLNFSRKPISAKPQQSLTLLHGNQHNTSDLVELLQTSAIEHLTTFRQLQVRDFGSVATIVTTDFEALYAYKHDDYQRCLQLSTQNVVTLLCADYIRMPYVPTFPMFLRLFDDEIVSLIALRMIVHPDRRCVPLSVCISHLILSMYLMVQCQLKLCQPLTRIKINLSDEPSFNDTLDYWVLKIAQRKYAAASIGLPKEGAEALGAYAPHPDLGSIVSYFGYE